MFGVLGDELEMVFVDRKHEHSEAITDLAADKDLVVSADESGSVVLWTLPEAELIKTHTLPDFGYVVSTLASRTTII